MDKIKILPMGSMVKLAQSPNEIVMVIARTVLIQDEKRQAKYIVINYPYGADSQHSPLPIYEDEIIEIVTEGYSDVKDEDYIKELIQEAEENEAQKVENPSLDSSETVDAAVPESSSMVQDDPHGDPFYKFRNDLDH